jgi:PAS domain-containing protein
MPEISELQTDSAVYKTLLESTQAIPWKIDWPTMTFGYIGPQIEPLLGWRQDSWVSANDWASRIHPEDRERVVNFCIAQSQAGVDHEADYRALTQDNGYVWIRDVVHVVRNDAGRWRPWSASCSTSANARRPRKSCWPCKRSWKPCPSRTA